MSRSVPPDSIVGILYLGFHYGTNPEEQSKELDGQWPSGHCAQHAIATAKQRT
jgi:hypothetical protein